MVDTKALAEAFDEVAKEHLLNEIREWIVYTAPPHIQKLYQTYLDIVEQNKKEEMFYGN